MYHYHKIRVRYVYRFELCYPLLFKINGTRIVQHREWPCDDFYRYRYEIGSAIYKIAGRYNPHRDWVGDIGPRFDDATVTRNFIASHRCREIAGGSFFI